jgi:hypothetical protein
MNAIFECTCIGIPAAAPKGQGNLGAEGNPQVVQGTTHQRAIICF